MVVLDIEIITKNGMFCSETVVATVVNYYKKRYEAIFLDAWDFNFEFTATRIGSNIDSGNWKLIENTEYYAGIRIINIKANKDSIKENIIYEITNKKPVLVNVDSFYYPYGREKDKERHILFPYLILGFDETEQEFLIYDIHYLKEIHRIKYEGFIEGILEYSIFNESKIEHNFNWNDSLKKISRSFLDNKINKLRLLSTIFDKGINYQEEAGDESDYINIPIVRKMEEMSRGRNLFLLSLSYINEISLIGNYEDIYKNINYSASRWNLIKVLLIKSYIKNSFDEKLNFKIAQIMSEIADYEEKACNLLLETTVSGRKENVNLNVISVNTIKEPIYYDLRTYFNNKGIYYGGLSTMVDLTGLGQYISINNLNESLYMPANMFDMRNFSIPAEDNISCQGQILDNVNDKYNCIAILGCSEWGSFSADLKISYNDNTLSYVMIGFSSWIIKEPVYGEKIALKGKLEEINNKSYNYEECQLFYKIYSLDNKKVIESIQLPYCPSMHIFSITFGK